MLYRDIATEAVHNLQRNKLRTVLTMMGIVIGAFAVLMIWALSAGLQNFLKNQLDFVSDPRILECSAPGGVNLRKIQSMALGSVGSLPRKIEEGEAPTGLANLKVVYFTKEHIEQLKRIPHVESIHPAVVVPGKWIRLAGSKEHFEVYVGPWYGSIEDRLIAGRAIDESSPQSEVLLSSAYCQVFGWEPQEILGKTVHIEVGKHPFLQKYLQTDIFSRSWEQFRRSLHQLFDREVKDEKIDYHSMDHSFSARVVGVLPDNMFSSLVFASEDLVKQAARLFFHQRDLYTEDNYGIMVQVVVDAPENVPSVRRQIHSYDMSTSSMEEHLAAFRRIFRIVEMSLTLFASIALVVAALGIINTLLMTVSERKQEIGILKALGATSNDILLLFATEAATMGLFGGIFGIAIGSAVAVVGNHLAAEMFPVFWQNTPLFILQASHMTKILGFSTILGILGGIYPAYKGANMQPIVALRHE